MNWTRHRLARKQKWPIWHNGVLLPVNNRLYWWDWKWAFFPKLRAVFDRQPNSIVYAYFELLFKISHFQVSEDVRFYVLEFQTTYALVIHVLCDSVLKELKRCTRKSILFIQITYLKSKNWSCVTHKYLNINTLSTMSATYQQ